MYGSVSAQVEASTNLAVSLRAISIAAFNVRLPVCSGDATIVVVACECGWMRVIVCVCICVCVRFGGARVRAGCV